MYIIICFYVYILQPDGEFLHYYCWLGLAEKINIYFALSEEKVKVRPKVKSMEMFFKIKIQEEE